MFFDRVDVFNIQFFQSVRKFVKVILLKIHLKIIAAERDTVCVDKIFPGIESLQNQTAGQGFVCSKVRHDAEP